MTLTNPSLLQLGIPTANIPPSGLDQYPNLSTGVYFGLVSLQLVSSHIQDNSHLERRPPITSEGFPSEAQSQVHSIVPSHPSISPKQEEGPQIYPAVLSIGYNPFYKNTVRSIEIHILRSFAYDFYGASLNLMMLGFIRPECDYISVESLIEDIRIDCDVARRSLARESYRRFGEGKEKEWLMDFRWSESDMKGGGTKINA